MKKNGARKLLWGCLGGCLGFALIAGCLFALGWWYLTRAMPVVPPETFVGPQAVAFVWVRIEPDDEFMTALPVRVAGTPAIGRRLAAQTGYDVTQDGDATTKTIRGVAPLRAVLTVQPADEEGRFFGGMATSVARASRLAALSFESQRDTDVPRTPYDGIKIGRLRSGAFYARRGNNLMVSERRKQIEGWADRLQRQEALESEVPTGEERIMDIGGSPVLQAAYRHVDRRMPIVFACANEHGAFDRLLESEGAEEVRAALAARGLSASAVTWLAGGFKPLDDRGGELLVLAQCADAATAAALADAIPVLVQARWGENAPVVRVERPEPALVRATFGVPDLAALMGRMVVRLQALAAERAARGEPAAPSPSAPVPPVRVRRVQPSS